MPHLLPTLRILSVESLLLHENHDPLRTESLKRRLRSEGFLRNPPIVTPLDDSSSRYVVLDGANRTMALRTMGVPHVLAQVVVPQKNICLKTWNHVLMDTNSDNFIARVQKISGLHVRCSQNTPGVEILNTGEIARVLLSTGEVYILSKSENNRVDNTAFLNQLERACRENGRLERTSLTSPETLAQDYPNYSALIIYHAIEIGTVLANVRSGRRLPAGVTRFIVSPRALRVNYPLTELMTENPLAKKNITLQDWMQTLITERGIRCYEESTVIFDE